MEQHRLFQPRPDVVQVALVWRDDLEGWNLTVMHGWRAAEGAEHGATDTFTRLSTSEAMDALDACVWALVTRPG